MKVKELKQTKIPPLVSVQRIERAVPLQDCSGRKYSEWEREDIVRYMLQAAEMQRDDDWYGTSRLSNSANDEEELSDIDRYKGITLNI